MDVRERLLRKVDERHASDLVEGKCWIWKGATDPETGYGRITVDRRTKYTHRVAYELHIGPIPVGLHVDHLCRVRACCNPAHLEPVTCKVNCERGVRAAKTHCPAGHPYSGDNLRIHTDSRGYARRICRTCNAAKAAQWRAARSARRDATWAKYLPGQSPASRERVA